MKEQTPLNLNWWHTNTPKAFDHKPEIISTLDVSDYDNLQLVQHLHEINKQDPFSLNAARNVESVILDNVTTWTYENHLELWAGSHPIPYPNIFNKAKNIFRTDWSSTELNLAKKELSWSDIQDKDKIVFREQTFLDALTTVNDNSIDSIWMRFCINYLHPEDMPTFFELLKSKMKHWGVLVANLWLPTWVLPVQQEWAKYLFNGKEIKKDTPIHDWDPYTIIFLDKDGKPQNAWTTKIWYSGDFFSQFSDNDFTILVWPANQLCKNDLATPMKMLLVKKQ